MVHIMDRGQTLRFYRADRVRVTGDILRELLTEEVWRNTEPWSSNFAPGGNRYVVPSRPPAPLRAWNSRRSAI